jgi:hypothetical protein
VIRSIVRVVRHRRKRQYGATRELLALSIPRLSNPNAARLSASGFDTAPGFKKTSFVMEDPVEPMATVTDRSAEPIAYLEGTRHVMVARKQLAASFLSWRRFSAFQVQP